jgi:sulfur-carrier protein adenylyltransferase/sulfurtransferase
MKQFSLAAELIDPAQLREVLQHPGSGAFCTFEGRVRNCNEGRAVSGLEYESYAELALEEGERIIEEAIARHGLIAARCVHRTGHLAIGDLAVWIGVSSAHRDEAFRACRYIIDEIKHRLPIWKKEHYIDGDAAWVACTHTHGEHEHRPQHGLTTAFVPDYSRQTRLREVGEAGQTRLAAARVLVIGAGGLGCPVLGYLAGAGVGTLGIVDGDRLDASNLHRQTLYDARDLGQRKVDLAARRIAALNPSVAVQTYAEPLHAMNVIDVFGQYDLVIECTDDIASRYLSNDASILTSTPLILASVYQYEGQLQVVAAKPGAPCLRCLWPQPPAPGTVGTCIESGVLGPVPGVLGSMQAVEALRLLLDLPRLADHALLLVNLLDGTSQRLPVDAAMGCARHRGCADAAHRGLTLAQSMLDVDLAFDSLDHAIAAGYALVDLREQEEIDARPLPAPSQRLPFARVTALAPELRPQPTLLVCASGRRSGAAARALRGQGMSMIHSLFGGLAALAAPHDHASG